MATRSGGPQRGFPDAPDLPSGAGRELDDRKAAILRAIVEEYIQTAQPVGSRHVLDSADIKVSSATVRNDMATLEREGFVAQPHTSAGRIPTEKGYRFFVDHLSSPGLSTIEVQTVRSFFDGTGRRIEALLADTSRLLSDLTSYAAVVVGPPHETATVRSVQLVRLQSRLVLVLVVLSGGGVERFPLHVDEVVTDVSLNAAAVRLTSVLHDTVLSEAGTHVHTTTGDPTTDGLVERVLRLVGKPEANGDLFVGGASNMATAFEATDTLRAVLSVLEEQFVMVTLLRDILDRGMQVAIGSETGVEPLSECALVVAPYEVDGQPTGTIGVLGPTRMNYPQALAAVAVVSRQLGTRLSQD
ncbi:MAG: heat-inducible transcriptional repressor HrcA [Acidimicrobiia bacterium]|nr:heat-inducible transcriptional repressor HrcA [Acidimicrobiia bacterium]